MVRPQLILDLHEELIVDNFAGGGGASMGIEMALGRHVDIAVNHDREAIALHQANHPQTQHLCEDVFKVNPTEATQGRPVGLAWFSPDCKHFSKAKGGKPRSKKIRGLAWVAVKWAAAVRPRVMVLENVEEFQDWGPLLPDNTPDPMRKSETFQAFVDCLSTGIATDCPAIAEIKEYLGKKFPMAPLLSGLGYKVEWRELRASDYGAPTIRKRLFLIARCDGKPIIWPNPTHGDPEGEEFRLRNLKPWKTAAECINWSLPCPSIFLTKAEGRVIGVKRPLAEATMRRLARGVKKFVLDAKEPFIVQYHSAKRPGDDRVSPVTAPIGTQTTERRFGLAVPYVAPLTHQGGDRVESVEDPFRTITGAHRGEKALAMALLSDASRPALCRSAAADEPMRTQCAEVKGGHFQLVQAFLAKHYGGVVGTQLKDPIGTVTSVDHHSLVATHIESLYSQKANEVRAGSIEEPLKTITASPRHAVVASHLTKFYGTTTGQETDAPIHSITSQGQHIAEVRAFLMKYYSEGGQDQALKDPLHTVTTKARLGLVTIHGVDYAITDIGMRMLAPRELYRGQGFPETYIINIVIEKKNRKGRMVWKPLTQEAQIRMCGNAVPPPFAAAIATANVPDMSVWRNGEQKAFLRQLEHLSQQWE